jgi:hypothetical protein
MVLPRSFEILDRNVMTHREARISEIDFSVNRFDCRAAVGFDREGISL